MTYTANPLPKPTVSPMPAAPSSSPVILPSPSGALLREAIRALAAGASLETAAKHPSELDAFSGLLRDGMDVYIAWIPGRLPRQMIELAAHLRRLGFRPVPHLAAREIASEADLRELLGRLQGEAGVERVLAVAGDMRQPAGSYGSSLELLETGLLQAHGIRHVGVAAYPEGHPAIAESELDAALDAKLAYAALHGLDLTLVTQFCFDGAAIADWLARLRSRSVRSPVRVGLAGPATLRTLLAYAARCGIGPSARALGTRTVSLARLLTERGPESVLRTLVERGAHEDIAGLHLFGFGGGRLTARWMDAVAAGRFELQGSGFVVE